MATQIKSRQRVSEHGEVYTNPREVNAMLDLVKAECNKIESTFLEPACGNGNFLVEILSRKLSVVKKKFGKVQKDYELNALKALGSIYGIDILEDNCQESRSRMLQILENEYRKKFKSAADNQFLESAHYILKQNIINGDCLTGIQGNGDPIMLAEWTLVMDKFKRRDYRLCDMLAYSDLEDKNTRILEPVKEYPLTHYKALANLGKEADQYE